MSNTEKTIADIALEGGETAEVIKEEVAPVVEEAVKEVKKEVVKPVKQVEKEIIKPVKPVSKYVPGSYRAEKFLRIIKELTYKNVKNADGKIQKTHGTWATASNMIEFKKGIETILTAEDLELPAIQRLIDTKVIFRVG